MTYEEMILLIRKSTSAEAVDQCREEIMEMIPSFRKNENNCSGPFRFRMWHHAVNTLSALPENCRDDMLYLAALLHDIGKTGTDPSVGHAHASAELVRNEGLPRLLADGAQISVSEQQRLLFYIEHHEDHLGMEAQEVLSGIGNIPRDVYRNLMLLEAADSIAWRTDPVMLKREEVCRMVAGVLNGRHFALK